MSLKKSQEIGNYMDAIKVKIAEEYKPPPKINMLMTHTQRLTFNKQIRDNLPKYDFSLENSILQKVREWKNNRLVNEEQRKMRLQVLKDKESDNSDAEEEENLEKELDNSAVSYEKEIAVSSIGTSGTTTYSNGMLVPTKASNYYSTILQPIPLNSDNQKYFSDNSGVTSPFNISEFEADTSSPFDNVALKSINDVEELAKVLKLEDATTASYANFHSTSNVPTYPNYNSASTFATSYNTQHPMCTMNGYYNSCDIGSVGSFPTNFQCSPPSNSYISSYTRNNFVQQEKKTQNDEKPINFPSIKPKISPELPATGKIKNDEISHKRGNMNANTLPDPFNDLPKHLQEMSKSISSMGFPLARVARTCKAIGNDNKKVLDHLLAMSELLDLGFAEDKISEALLLFDNDRDKALDKLVS